ncbi:MAG TPA: CoA transferase [Rubrivivax sp.]|nr:CoA transferase [Rubrivivax sp.]HPO18473.1 CoA transferase [Rubrivivax sp.]
MTTPAPLQGLRVVEFSAFVAAPSAGLALAQLGAEVIRVDPIGGNIDIQRAPRTAQGRSLYWASMNRGKRSVELNVRSDEGRALLQRLICASGQGAAVFLTNLGVDGELSYEALAQLRPDLIMVQLVGSSDGANAVDYTVNCAAGFPGITGSGRDGPVNHVLPAWDLVAGQMLAFAVLAAERHWRATAQGQHVKLALSDVALASAANLGYLADVELNGTQRRADGNFLYGAYGDSFATADGRHAMVVAITDRQWAALLRATGLQDALPKAAEALGQRLDSEDARYAARELISTALRPWFAQRTLAEVAAAFGERTLLWGPYRSFAQMLAEDPRCSEANPMFRRTAQPGIGEVLTAATPLRFGAAEDAPAGISPRLGEHTHAVLREQLALDDAALRSLEQAGAIGAG